MGQDLTVTKWETLQLLGGIFEARLSKFAYKCYFEDFSEDLVDMKAGYIEGVFEPEYLPARYPVALTKSIKAIGYGMYSQFPNYNFKELVEFTLKLMDDPEYDKVIYPDIPNNCEIIDDGQFDEIRRTGKGNFRMKSKVKVDYENYKIEVLSVPQGTDLSSITEKIVEMGKSGELIGFVDVHNMNDKRNSKGKKKNKTMLQSSKPKNKLRICFSFCLLSSSAITINSSLDKSSSIVTPKYFDIALSESILGYPLPDSHFEIAVLDTQSTSASSSCVSPFCFLNSCNFSFNSIIFSLF